MIDRSLRTVKRRALTPISTLLAHRLVRRGAGPVTWAGLGIGLAAALAAALGAFVAALALWLLNRVLDGLDGEVARRLGCADDRGGYLDMLVDLTVYAAVPIGAAIGTAGLTGATGAPGSSWTWPLVAALLATYYVNLGSYAFLAALMEKRGRGAATRGEATSLVMPAGLVEGFETVVLVSAMLALPVQLPLWLGLTAVLVALTAMQRAWWGSRMLAGESP